MVTPQTVGHPLVVPHLFKISGKTVTPVSLKAAPTIRVVRDKPLVAVDVLKSAIAAVVAKNSNTTVVAVSHLFKISGKTVTPVSLKSAPTIRVVRDKPLVAVDVLKSAIAAVVAKNSNTTVVAVSHLFKISGKPINVSASAVATDSNFLHCAWSPDNAAWVFWMGVETDLMPTLTSPNSIVANLVNKHIWWRSMP